MTCTRALRVCLLIATLASLRPVWASDDTPPDPRQGESLDGRAPPTASPARKSAQAALAVPRVTARAVLLAPVAAVSVVERYQLLPRLRVLTTTDDGRIGVRPELRYSSGFAPSVGLRLFDARHLGPGSLMQVRGHTAGPDIAHAEALVGLPAGLLFQALYDRRNDRLFGGIGPTSNEELEASGRRGARYRSEGVQVEARYDRRVRPWLAVGARSDVVLRRYGSTDVRGDVSIAQAYPAPPGTCPPDQTGCVDEALVPGFNEGLRLVHTGLVLSLGTAGLGRDDAGVLFTVNGDWAHGIAGDPSHHVRGTGTLAAGVGGRDRALRARLQAMVAAPLGSAPVPFEELPSPTGPFGLRGLAAGRLRDESALLATLEYRWLVSSDLDGSLFVDYGGVAGPAFSNLRWDVLLPSFGAGLRVYDTTPAAYWDAGLEASVQLAYAPEEGVVRLLLTAAGF